MFSYIPGIAEPSRRLNTSALPDAPVVVEDERTSGHWGLRPQLAQLLRNAAGHELRLADRIDPACRPQAA